MLSYLLIQTGRSYGLSVFFIVTLLFSTPDYAVSNIRDNIVATYIYQLAQNISWTNNKTLRYYKIHLIDTNKKHYHALQYITKNATLHNKKIILSYSTDLSFPEDIQILFVANHYVQHLKSIYQKIHNHPILLITDHADNPHDIMLDFYDEKDNTLKFRINKANILNHHLTISPNIILLGGSEIDIAQLYKDSQTHLQKNQQYVTSLQQNLHHLQNQIIQNEKQYQLLKENIQDLKKTITQLTQNLYKAQTTLQQKQDELNQQRQAFRKYQHKIRTQTERYNTLLLIIDQQEKAFDLQVSSQQQEILKRKQILQEQQRLIETQKQNLKQQKKTLHHQTRQIQQQQHILKEQNKEIVYQKNMLYLLILILVLFLLLVLIILLAFFKNKKSKQLLEKQGELLQQSTIDLLLAKQHAEKANHSKSVFLANMSHELRTPMNAVIGFLELTLEQYTLPEPYLGYITTAESSARSLLHLLNDILDISKMENNKLSLEKVEFNLKELLSSVLNTLKLASQEKNITITLHDEVLHNKACLVGDPVRIRQIFINLLGNAIKFTKQGEINIFISDDTHLVAAQHVTYIQIHDTGIGIPSEKLDTIFDAFTQSDDSTTRHFGGTGLGTTISKQLITKMGGKIWIESIVHQGTQVHFYLPMVLTACQASKSSISSPSTPTPKSTICYHLLIVDDVKTNALLACIRLEAAGYKVTQAENGKIALELLQQQHFDAILMDIHMPVMDGLTATRSIREQEKNSSRHIPVIALTASVLKEDMAECLHAGMDDIVTKPIDFGLLFDKLQQHLTVIDPLPTTTKQTTDSTTHSASFNKESLIQGKKGLQYWKDEAIYFAVLHDFSQQHAHDDQAVQIALQAKDYQRVLELTHRIKGLAGNLCMPHVEQTAQRLHIAIKQQHYHTLKPLFSAFSQALQLSVHYIQENISSPPASTSVPQKQPVKKQDKLILVQQLITCLQQSDPNKISCTLEKLKPYLTEKDFYILDKYIDNYDMDDAIRWLNTTSQF